MNVLERANNSCELCASQATLKEYRVGDSLQKISNEYIAICDACETYAEKANERDQNQWYGLKDAIWSEHTAVKVQAMLILDQLKDQYGWAIESLDMVYLEENEQKWFDQLSSRKQVVHKDINGVVLQHGDTVTITKDLNVKGSSLVPKRGMTVRNIRLDPDNDQFIEGKVDGQLIVIRTEFVKK